MKAKQFFLGMAVIVMAIGAAFVTRASEPESGNMLLNSEVTSTQLGYYKINDNPCEPFIEVDCNPLPVTAACNVTVPGHGTQQMRDASCQLLYVDQP